MNSNMDIQSQSPFLRHDQRVQDALEQALTLGHINEVQKRQLQQLLHESYQDHEKTLRIQQEWKSIIDSLHLPLCLVDHECRIIRANLAYAEWAQQPVNQLTGKVCWRLFPELASAPLQCLQSIQHRCAQQEELTLPSGQIIHARYHPVFEQGQYHSHLLSFEDISAQRSAEARGHLFSEALRDSEEQLRAISNAAKDAIIMIDHEGRIRFWNPAAAGLFGYTADEALGKDLHLLLAPERYHAAALAGWDSFARSGQGDAIGRTLELEGLHRDGHTFPMELSVSAIEFKHNWHAVGIIRDITERAQKDACLQTALRAQRTLSSCNKVLIHAGSETKLLQQMCQTIIRQVGYAFSWIGLIDEQTSGQLRQAACASRLSASCEQNFCGKCIASDSPAAEVLSTAEVQVLTDPDRLLRALPCHKSVSKTPFSSCIILPLLNNNASTFGVLCIFADQQTDFTADEVSLLEELAADLAYGVQALQIHSQRDHFQQLHLQSAESLKESLISTIRAIAMTVEKRDPYTAGHQNRVADLSAAIGAEIGLDPGRLEGLRLGAMIHDIGKIYLPSEILNRPGRLSAPEFALIKTHPDVGYDIIKDVNFPWPVAEMILQHHERLDGSGYPKGLKGDEIITEARIIAVADVVEAINSHRPYRPAVGLEVALEEIERHKGEHYDAEVVDACIRLFREQGYTLPEN